MSTEVAVKLLSYTHRPNLVCYLALHQCYDADPTYLDLDKLEKLSEAELGKRIVEKCIKYGHWGVIEAAHLVFNVTNACHSVLVQARTHRHLSFAAQSQRYTSENVYNLGRQSTHTIDDVEKVYYFRKPNQQYFDRKGNKYTFSVVQYYSDIDSCFKNAQEFANRLDLGFAPEHARDMLFQNVRQHFVVSGNVRAFLHFLDLRTPKDAQLEIREVSQGIFEHIKFIMPEVAEWYYKNRYGKCKLSP